MQFVAVLSVVLVVTLAALVVMVVQIRLLKQQLLSKKDNAARISETSLTEKLLPQEDVVVD